MKIYSKEFSAKDLLEVSMDSRMRTGTTPFGAPEGQVIRYLGRAVAWKGVKGLAAVKAINPRVGAGLEKAQAISRAHHETGVALVQYPNGETVTMPMKCYAMMADAARPVTLISTLAQKRPWVKKAPVAPVVG